MPGVLLGVRVGTQSDSDSLSARGDGGVLFERFLCAKAEGDENLSTGGGLICAVDVVEVLDILGLCNRRNRPR